MKVVRGLDNSWDVVYAKRAVRPYAELWAGRQCRKLGTTPGSVITEVRRLYYDAIDSHPKNRYSHGYAGGLALGCAICCAHRTAARKAYKEATPIEVN